ncbi:hypothetical protein [Sorangium atrum]|uniref:Secreted protein n=1 Tax=Sorangium atrum TaxID=2995308 RepID=A0ABT5BYL1_9BACT|nr:hypothetical protein [Sorangium aterium]MDC0678715.1 hypothetical protein [Sorangium aterium]
MNRLIRLGALSAFLSLVLWGGKDVAAAPIPAALSSKQLKDLTTADEDTTCQSLTPSLVLTREDTCEFVGLLWSTVGQVCTVVRDKCLAEAQQPPARAEDTATASCLPPAESRAGCTATVAEYEACMLANAEKVRALDCDSATSALEAPVPACDLIAQKCPDLGNTDDDQGEGEAQP